MVVLKKRRSLVVLDDKEPEWTSTEDVKITSPESCEIIKGDQIMPVVTLDENFSKGIIFTTTKVCMEQYNVRNSGVSKKAKIDETSFVNSPIGTVKYNF